MDDLTSCLYEFLLERRMGYLWEDEEYKACNLALKLQEEQMQSCLDAEQKRQLDRLLDRAAERDSLERAHLFQAALDLVKELNALTGQSQIAVAK